MRSSILLLTIAAAACARVPDLALKGDEFPSLTEARAPVPMVFLDRMMKGAMPNVAPLGLGIAGDRAGTIMQLETLLYGSPVYLGVIACTTGAGGLTNHSTGVPFNNTGNALCGKPLLIQPSAEVFLLPVATNTGSVTTATGVDVLAKERVVILMTSKTGSDASCWLACITPSGTSNLSVWELH